MHNGITGHVEDKMTLAQLLDSDLWPWQIDLPSRCPRCNHVLEISAEARRCRECPLELLADAPVIKKKQPAKFWQRMIHEHLQTGLVVGVPLMVMMPGETFLQSVGFVAAMMGVWLVLQVARMIINGGTGRSVFSTPYELRIRTGRWERRIARWDEIETFRAPEGSFFVIFKDGHPKRHKQLRFDGGCVREIKEALCAVLAERKQSRSRISAGCRS